MITLEQLKESQSQTQEEKSNYDTTALLLTNKRQRLLETDDGIFANLKYISFSIYLI